MRIIRDYIALDNVDLAKLENRIDKFNTIKRSLHWNWNRIEKRGNGSKSYLTIRPGYGLSSAHLKLLKNGKRSMPTKTLDSNYVRSRIFTKLKLWK